MAKHTQPVLEPVLEQGGGYGIGDEVAVSGDAPVSTANQEIEELRRAVGPQHVRCMCKADLGSNVSVVDEESGVVPHPAQAVRFQFIVEGCGRSVAGGGIA